MNHGLVHYYFGSNEDLLVRALERFTERLIERQRELYAADVPFVEKWRTAMRYLVSEDADLREDLARAAGARLEQPRARERGSRDVNAEWRGVLTDAFEEPHRELGIDAAAGRARLARDDVQPRASSSSAWAASRRATRELLDWIDGWLSS